MRSSVRRYDHLYITIAVIAFSTSVVAAQTRIDIPDNKYSLHHDVRIGRQAAAEIEQELPFMRERSYSDNYMVSAGRRLLTAIPRSLRHRGFVYRFDVVNVRDVNGFALTGGPLYAKRDLIEAAANEGQLAGVVAHEVAYVASRHGTAQPTEAHSSSGQLRAPRDPRGFPRCCGSSTDAPVAEGRSFSAVTLIPEIATSESAGRPACSTSKLRSDMTQRNFNECADPFLPWPLRLQCNKQLAGAVDQMLISFSAK